MTGQWVDSYPEEVVKIYEAGHDLGNHSQSHPYMSQLEEAEQVQELMNVHNKVKQLTGHDMFLFRAPTATIMTKSSPVPMKTDTTPYNGY